MSQNRRSCPRLSQAVPGCPNPGLPPTDVDVVGIPVFRIGRPRQIREKSMSELLEEELGRPRVRYPEYVKRDQAPQEKSRTKCKDGVCQDRNSEVPFNSHFRETWGVFLLNPAHMVALRVSCVNHQRSRRGEPLAHPTPEVFSGMDENSGEDLTAQYSEYGFSCVRHVVERVEFVGFGDPRERAPALAQALLEIFILPKVPDFRRRNSSGSGFGIRNTESAASAASAAVANVRRLRRS